MTKQSLARLTALTTEDELREVLIVTKKPTLKLKYIGKQEWPGQESLRLWNIIQPGNAYHESTRTEAGLRELGVIK